MYKVYSTQELIKKAKTKPENYAICLKSDCPLCDHCHRAIEAKNNKGDQLLIRIVNPLAIEKNDGECPAFRDSRKKIIYAIGFRSRMDAINEDTRRVYKILHSAFSNTHYYDMLNGNTLITPEEQEFIRSTAEKCGYNFIQDDFDVLVEADVW